MYGGFPEWPKGTDCKSAGDAFGGSNPPSPTKNRVMPYGMARFFCCGVRGVEVYTPLGVNPPSPTKKNSFTVRWSCFFAVGSWSRSLHPFRGESTIPHHAAASYVLFKTASFHPFPAQNRQIRLPPFCLRSCGGRFFCPCVRNNLRRLLLRPGITASFSGYTTVSEQDS